MRADLDNHGGAAADLEAVGKEICSRSVGSFFGDFSGPATTAVLSMSDVCRDWGIKGYLNAPLIDVIRQADACVHFYMLFNG